MQSRCMCTLSDVVPRGSTATSPTSPSFLSWRDVPVHFSTVVASRHFHVDARSEKDGPRLVSCSNTAGNAEVFRQGRLERVSRDGERQVGYCAKSNVVASARRQAGPAAHALTRSHAARLDWACRQRKVDLLLNNRDLNGAVGAAQRTGSLERDREDASLEGEINVDL